MSQYVYGSNCAVIVILMQNHCRVPVHTIHLLFKSFLFHFL